MAALTLASGDAGSWQALEAASRRSFIFDEPRKWRLGMARSALRKTADDGPDSPRKAVFPRAVQPTLEWNRQFARELLNFARQAGGHAYFMPVRESVEAYLGGVL